ncbi:MAG: methyltransferase [Bacteroidales bacterium]|jgi:tRNA1Val (adenine37-N6)-methyltransferase|nr:methyltransferase [Bacteroidales bacterium]
MEPFRFKRFSVIQEKAAMKVNTDGVLLGCWTAADPSSHQILDVGTGSGVIALIMAQRMSEYGGYFKIEGIDIDGDSVEEAGINFLSSPWNASLGAVLSSFQDFMEGEGEWDMIVSNPPFFIDSMKSPNVKRSLSRHAETLSQREIINNSLRLLRTGGKASLIFPAAEGREFLYKLSFLLEKTGAGNFALFPIRLCEVFTKSGKPCRRIMIELVKVLLSGAEVYLLPEPERLFIYDGEGGFSKKYIDLTQDFYIGL